MWHPYFTLTSGSLTVSATVAALALQGFAATVSISEAQPDATPIYAGPFPLMLHYGVPWPPVLNAAGALTNPWLAWVGFTTDRVNELIMAGTTAQRPTKLRPGFGPYFDYDLGKPIWYSGAAWVDATGASV